MEDTGTTDTGSDTETDTDSTAQTAETGDTGTDTGEPSNCVATEAHVACRTFYALWVAPSGEAVGIGVVGSAVRDPAGTWTDAPSLDAPITPNWLDGSGIDEVWAIGTYDV